MAATSTAIAIRGAWRENAGKPVLGGDDAEHRDQADYKARDDFADQGAVMRCGIDCELNSAPLRGTAALNVRTMPKWRLPNPLNHPGWQHRLNLALVQKARCS